MPFKLGDCVRIEEGAEPPSRVGMQGTWQGTASSVGPLPGAQSLEPESTYWVAFPDRPDTVVIDSKFVKPCDEADLVAS